MSLLTAPAVIEMLDVVFGYDDRRIIDQVNLRIPKGKVTALMGASGGGKTTLLRLMAGQHHASQGQVLFEGKDIARLSQPELYAVRRRMGMLFQFGALFTDMSVFDNVAFPLREHSGLPEGMVRDIVLFKLNAVGLRGARDLMPSQLSGGMARRVALARAIALDPAVVLYDEPFAGLDPIALGTAARLIRDLNEALGMSSVLVSHDVAQTLEVADWVVVLANGQIAIEGTPDEVRQSPNPLVHQFVHALPDGPVRFHYPGPSVQDDFGPASGGHA